MIEESPLTEAMAEDSKSIKAPTKEQLSSLSRLAEEADTVELHIEQTEITLKQLKGKLLQLTDKDVPDLMSEVGMSKFTTTEGVTIEIKPIIQASITKAKAPAAFAWLRDNDYGDLIKNQIIIIFGKGEDDKKELLVQELSKDYTLETKQNVHTSTLKAFVKECRENGVPIPDDPFSIYEFNRAKITSARRLGQSL